MTEPHRGAASKDRGNIWVIVPFVIAVVGTVVMLFTNSANALKVSLIFALWAGAAGIIVVDRARRDRDVARAAADEREHELANTRAQLEQAVVQAREAGSQPGQPQPAPVLNEQDLEVLRELQEEIKSLRSQLEEMRGAVFEYEPAAVQASARRIPEIGLNREPGAPVFPEPTQPSRPGPSGDETLEIDIVREPDSTRRDRPVGAPSADAIAGRLGQQPAREQPNPLSAIINERTNQAEVNEEPVTPEPVAEPAPQPQPEPQPEAAPTPEPEPVAEEAPQEAPAPAPEAAAEPAEPAEEPAARHRGGGRRRRDEQGAGALSVADLLARRENEGS